VLIVDLLLWLFLTESIIQQALLLYQGQNEENSMERQSCSLEFISSLISETQKLEARIDKQRVAIEEFGFQLEVFGSLPRASGISPEVEYIPPTQ
jgi:hypothetical protein